MGEFKNFVEMIDCDVIPITRDETIYLAERIVSEEEMCIIVGNNHYECGEPYYNFISIQAKTLAELSDKIVQELYSRGFSPRSFTMIDNNKVALEYSFMSDEAWAAKRQIKAVVVGDITDAKDHRRNDSLKGEWFKPVEFKKIVGLNQANKIFEIVNERRRV